MKSENEKKVAECYSTWGKTYYDEYYGEKAPYPAVHTDLLLNLLKDHKIKTLLDAGCGPASFLRDTFKEGYDLWGFDLTAEMVEEAKRIFEDANLDPDRIWEGSVLDKACFKQPNHEARKFDAAICTGVLPHIPEKEDKVVIENLFDVVESGGIVALEARNQLFSLFTLNRYSYDFFEKDLINPEGTSLDPFKAKALEDMKPFFRMDLPPVRKGKEDEPGYDEILSRTHNPLELKQIFEQQGFIDVKVLFYHFHSVPPMFSGNDPETFLKQSIEMENPEDWRGYFMASAFYIVGKKP